MGAAPFPADAIGALLAPLLDTLERVGWVQRNLHPPAAPRLAAVLAPQADALAGPLRALEALDGPADLRFMRDRLVAVAGQASALVAAFVEAASSGEPIALYRALRRFAGGAGDFEDLSHTYPRDENPRILDWLGGGADS